MKNAARLSALLLALLLSLAWLLAGRGEEVQPSESEDEAEELREPIPFGERDEATVLRVLHDGVVEEMSMAQYLLGVLRGEMPASFESEALRAQAIAARTYTLHRAQGEIAAHPEADACNDITCCKAFCTAEDAAQNWGGMAVYYEEKLARAVAETDGEVILYEGEPILAVFCSSTAGHTQGAGAVWLNDLPYLQTVESPETAELVPNFHSSADFTPEQFRACIAAALPQADLSGAAADWIREVQRNEAGFVTTLSVGGVTVKGNRLRGILGLRSPYFSVTVDETGLHFAVTGYGHGVGMSQYGANILAAQGMSGEEIVTHYYSGTSIGSYPD